MAKYYVQIDGKEIGLEVHERESGTVLQTTEGEAEPQTAHADFAAVHSNLNTGEGLYSLITDGKSYQVHVERTGDGLRMLIGRHRFDLRVLTEREWRLEKVAPHQTQHGGTMVIKAPMPGLVKDVLVSEGDEVQNGQRLIVLEAMKMENDITSPTNGRVTSVHVTQGGAIEGGKPLVTIEA